MLEGSGSVHTGSNHQLQSKQVPRETAPRHSPAHVGLRPNCTRRNQQNDEARKSKLQLLGTTSSPPFLFFGRTITCLIVLSSQIIVPSCSVTPGLVVVLVAAPCVLPCTYTQAWLVHLQRLLSLSKQKAVTGPSPSIV